MPIKKSKLRLDRVLGDVDKWATDIWPPYGWLDKYLAGEPERPGLAADDLYAFGMQKCAQSLLDVKQGDLVDAIGNMASGFARRAVAKSVIIEGLKGTRRIAIGDLDGFSNLMFGCIATGRPDVAKVLYGAVVAGLGGGYGVNDGHNLEIGTTLRYAGFGMSIISDWLERPLDLDKHALPRDPAWGPLVSLWRDPDPGTLLAALLSACDTHVERIGLTERECDSGNFEFDTPLQAVHPTEILAVLRLRDLLGLPNPAQIDHPLMQTPYARITCLPEFLTSRNHRDELLERFLDTVRRRDPGVLPPGLQRTGS
ncbi:hypothetical protein ACFWP0_05325 [Achromobacter sp. NPDC058515]|uniref:hypothetical protein n=1 Tax=Achromobacter sp. NPDC058515 TaxID=3346533 RepID=UPI0036488A20